MKNPVLLTLIASVVLIAQVRPAASQGPCAPVERMLAMLAEKYDEQVVLHGTVNSEVSMRLTASRSGSWTTLIVKDGIACLRLSGTRLNPGPDRQEPGTPS